MRRFDVPRGYTRHPPGVGVYDLEERQPPACDDVPAVQLRDMGIGYRPTLTRQREFLDRYGMALMRRLEEALAAPKGRARVMGFLWLSVWLAQKWGYFRAPRTGGRS